MSKWLVVGLGNPEGAYFNTFHNLGFVGAELLATRLEAEFKKKGNLLLAAPLPCFIVKPLTYMNRSGEAVLAIARKYKIETEKIIVLVDDLYIDKGKIKIVRGGGHAGHNGIRNINELLGTGNYVKVKIGIKPEKEVPNQASYVLSKIPPMDTEQIHASVGEAVSAVLSTISGMPFDKIQAKYNCKNEKR